MFYEANEPSSACRLWRIFMVETSTPPSKRNASSIDLINRVVKGTGNNSRGHSLALRIPVLVLVVVAASW